MVVRVRDCRFGLTDSLTPIVDARRNAVRSAQRRYSDIAGLARIPENGVHYPIGRGCAGNQSAGCNKVRLAGRCAHTAEVDDAVARLRQCKGREQAAGG